MIKPVRMEEVAENAIVIIDAKGKTVCELIGDYDDVTREMTQDAEYIVKAINMHK